MENLKVELKLDKVEVDAALANVRTVCEAQKLTAQEHRILAQNVNLLENLANSFFERNLKK